MPPKLYNARTFHSPNGVDVHVQRPEVLGTTKEEIMKVALP
jgi:hypothetical protein